MWINTGFSLVNIRDAREVVADREIADDRRTVFVVAADFGEMPRVPLARIELVYSASLVVTLDPNADDLALSPRERAERQASAECETCLRALASALQRGQSFCDLSGLYTPLIQP